MLHKNAGEEKSAKFDVLTLYDDMKIPKYKFNTEPIEASVASRLIKNELLDEGNARLNLATFCSTFMEDEAVELMALTLEKNAIDKSEYPSTIELENRCVIMIADLWHAEEGCAIGTSTVGSSEACMLAGLAMKFAWRDRAQALGLDITAKKPNLIISSGYQVCWKKFCVYWDVELRTVPMDESCMCLDPMKALAMADPYTIGIVAVLGHTFTGMFDDIAALNDAVEAHNEKSDMKLPIHVDAASGGLFVPFVDPGLHWDFQLKNVASINTSGHKYGLVYPGIGWVIWRDKQFLPRELVFEVSYLGGSIPTMAINFSRSASQIIGQYYNFLRLGFNGYRKIHRHTQTVAAYLAEEIRKTGMFELYNDGSTIPVICFKLKDNSLPWTLYQLSDYLEMKSWQIPVYALPDNLGDTVVTRIVCRSDLSMNLAEHFVDDLHYCIKKLSTMGFDCGDDERRDTKGFRH